MLSINPYLNFKGKAEEAFNFYKSVFGGEFSMLQRFKDVPGKEKMEPEDQEKIMHIALPIGNGNILMGSDGTKGFNLISGNNFYLTINSDNETEAETIFSKLSGEGKIQMPLQKTFWGAYFGMLEDKYGIQWMINCEKK